MRNFSARRTCTIHPLPCCGLRCPPGPGKSSLHCLTLSSLCNGPLKTTCPVLGTELGAGTTRKEKETLRSRVTSQSHSQMWIGNMTRDTLHLQESPVHVCDSDSGQQEGLSLPPSRRPSRSGGGSRPRPVGEMVMIEDRSCFSWRGIGADCLEKS